MGVYGTFDSVGFVYGSRMKNINFFDIYFGGRNLSFNFDLNSYIHLRKELKFPDSFGCKRFLRRKIQIINLYTRNGNSFLN